MTSSAASGPSLHVVVEALARRGCASGLTQEITNTVSP